MGQARRPMREFMWAQMMRGAGYHPATDLAHYSIDVNGVPRTYRLAPGPVPSAPLLLVLHGAGADGLGMAVLTGLAQRGPAAGFAVAFPDGFGRVWSDGRRGLRGGGNGPRRARSRRAGWGTGEGLGVDDVGFLTALVDRLVQQGIAAPGAVFAVGMSNGALLAEHMARHGLLDLAGIALVAGGGTVFSRQAAPMPSQSAAVVVFHGTADPLVPYSGGPIGPIGELFARHATRAPALAERWLAAPIEQVAADWATANGAAAQPSVVELPGRYPVTRLQWQALGIPPVLLHRIAGGGHTWPGTAQYLPAGIIGPATWDLDATAIMLDVFRGPRR